MKKQGALIFGLALLAVLSAYAFTFTVKYHEVAVRSRFGETNAESIVRDPGLNFRLPVFVDRVVTLDTRLQAVETPLEEITTADGLQIVVQAWLLWKVDAEGEAPLEFLRNYGELDGAAEPVETAFRTATTGAISAFPLEDLSPTAPRWLMPSRACSTTSARLWTAVVWNAWRLASSV